MVDVIYSVASGAVKKLKDMGDGSHAEIVVAQSVPVQLTDISGTVTTGGAAQTIAAANNDRRGFWLQNQSTGDLWINTEGTAGDAAPSLRLPAGSYYEISPHGIPTGAISLFGATTGQAFAAREW